MKIKKELGQHFLKNPLVLKKIAEIINKDSGDFVVEIGPGHGELTELIKNNKKKILLIEKDGELAANLEKKYEEEKMWKWSKATP